MAEVKTHLLFSNYCKPEVKINSASVVSLVHVLYSENQFWWIYQKHYFKDKYKNSLTMIFLVQFVIKNCTSMNFRFCGSS